jgi:hypothetical protein
MLKNHIIVADLNKTVLLKLRSFRFAFFNLSNQKNEIISY